LRPARSGVVPVPATLYIRQAILLGIEDEEALTCRDRVHPAAGRQGFGTLPTTMQHYQ
jgi:hypothetical protein